MKRFFHQGPVPVTVFRNEDQLGRFTASVVLDTLIEARKRGQKNFLLGAPAGRSCAAVFRHLGTLAAAAHVSMSSVVVVMMDDYVQKIGSGYVHCPENAHYSCRRFGEFEIRRCINRGLPRGARIPKANIWFPDPSSPPCYDTRIRRSGGIDIFLLASGASDGHVAFNQPGTARNSSTRIIPLHDTLRRDNLGTFPRFSGLEEVPRYGAGVGLGTIRRLSRQAILIIHGAHKQAAVQRLFALKHFSIRWPASVIYACRNPRIFLDITAAKGITE
jgi:glucosamine-6-phosphate deaminase